MKLMVILPLLLGSLQPAQAASNCVIYGGQLICNGGTSGFTDDNGNLWIQDRYGRSSVIQNLDTPTQEAPRRSGNLGGIQRPDGLVELE